MIKKFHLDKNHLKKIKSQIPPIITIVQNNFGFWKHQPTIRLKIHLCPLTKIRLKQIKLNLN